MSISVAALRGALCAAGFFAQLLHGPASLGGELPAARARAGVAVKARVRPPTAAQLLEQAKKTLEPPPAGDQIVLWALPLKPQLPIKVRRTISRSAHPLGEARGTTAIQVLPTTVLAATGTCRQWLPALPSGFVCAGDIRLQAGYVSAPPAQESATGWQHYRYGVVSAKQVALRSGVGRYLRATLRQGDGVTVIREAGGQSQLIGRQWLPSKNVELATPSTLSPLHLSTLPPGARPAWVVPPAGEAQVPAYPLACPASPLTAMALLPRYGLVFYLDGPARPGRVLVQLAEATRAALSAYPEAQAARALEVDAAVLRRFTRHDPPPEVGPEERWIDISLGDQVAAAYVGKTPLFATLVSTGKGNTTPPGSFFVYRKYLSQTMANQRGAAAQYDYREVPHAQFFNGRIGLHAALWHDSLGEPVSHGCVNLSPAAALQFFAFSSPALPTGWHSVTGFAPTPTPTDGNGDAEEPSGPTALIGTRVIVRR